MRWQFVGASSCTWSRRHNTILFPSWFQSPFQYRQNQFPYIANSWESHTEYKLSVLKTNQCCTTWGLAVRTNLFSLDMLSGSTLAYPISKEGAGLFQLFLEASRNKTSPAWVSDVAFKNRRPPTILGFMLDATTTRGSPPKPFKLAVKRHSLSFKRTHSHRHVNSRWMPWEWTETTFYTRISTALQEGS